MSKLHDQTDWHARILSTGGSAQKLSRSPRPLCSSTYNAKVLPGGARRSTSLYYGLLDLFREARWGPFDGDQLHLAASMAGNAAGDGTAVRAAPDGGCCVAHGSATSVSYRWHWRLGLHHRRAGRLLLRAAGLCTRRRRQAPVTRRHEHAHGSDHVPTDRHLLHHPAGLPGQEERGLVVVRRRHAGVAGGQERAARHRDGGRARRRPLLRRRPPHASLPPRLLERGEKEEKKKGCGAYTAPPPPRHG
uniref:At2g24240-like C-terminal beta-propeller domain-containing protein n=1 Tax=Oryza sativa subsp. japonica TaxID=39947 RepID=Q6H8B8_ORYSJ|nr:hypothetical protein [Oryza sativa Japonica Group]